jgi:hypothetical protein
MFFLIFLFCISAEAAALKQQQDQQQAQQLAQQQQLQQQQQQLNANTLVTIQSNQQPINLNGQQIYLNQANQPIILQQSNNMSSPMVIQQLPNGTIGVKQPQQVLIYPNQHQQQPVYIQQSQNVLPYDYPSQPAVPVYEGPKQAQHKEAYMRYIANLKRAQQIQQSPAANNSIANAAQAQQTDWFTSLDVRPNKIKEKRVQAPSLSWIENCPTDDVLQHLISLRYHMLNDALTIRKEDDLTNEKTATTVNEIEAPVPMEE